MKQSKQTLKKERERLRREKELLEKKVKEELKKQRRSTYNSGAQVSSLLLFCLVMSLITMAVPGCMCWLDENAWCSEELACTIFRTSTRQINVF